jgi:hypothetical protein
LCRPAAETRCVLLRRARTRSRGTVSTYCPASRSLPRVQLGRLRIR